MIQGELKLFVKYLGYDVKIYKEYYQLLLFVFELFKVRSVLVVIIFKEFICIFELDDIVI